MESLFILSTILFFAVAIYRIVLASIGAEGTNNSFYAYERPKTNPATGYRMFNYSGTDAGGNFYGQYTRI